MKKVSVVIPMYNDEKYIGQCIESVINQTYSNLEIIVVDDGSEDNSIEIVKGKNDERIRIIELKERSGASIARNTGTNAANGDYICFLDSDDYWKLNKIEKQVKFIEENDYEFIYGGYAYLKKGRFVEAHVPKKIDYKGLLKNHTIFTSTVMFNMKYLKKEDIYMPNFRRGQDMATWWQVLKKGITAHGITEVLAIYRVGKKSLSSNKIKALQRTWRILKREDIILIKRIYYFVCYAFNATRRRMSL